MTTDPRDSSQAIQQFLESVPSDAPDLGEPLREGVDDPLLDAERIELEDEDGGED